ncbi:epoxide hydrolase family protein [Gryllotalpicola koreensis]
MDFAPHTSPAAISELRARLLATRWPPAGTGIDPDPDWSLGTDPAYLRELTAYWADGFDWEAREAELNRLPRSFVEVGGTGIHVIHSIADREGQAPALLLLHGWPDSFWRYLKVLPLLAPDFDVVIPDMPGFSYSDIPESPLNSQQVAALYAELMTKLGYERFFAAGGDIGSHVARYLALDAPERVIAMHTMGTLPAPVADATTLTPEEQQWLRTSQAWVGTEGAYAAMHRTKPNTAAIGLTDSPAGLAAWIVEKLRTWSEGGLASYSLDDVLTNLSIYWFTGTIGSSMRMYRANAQLPLEDLGRRVEVPTGFSVFPGDISQVPYAWAERVTKLARFTEPAQGGHFAPYEVPELYAQELRDFFGLFL